MLFLSDSLFIFSGIFLHSLNFWCFFLRKAASLLSFFRSALFPMIHRRYRRTYIRRHLISALPLLTANSKSNLATTMLDQPSELKVFILFF